MPIVLEPIDPDVSDAYYATWAITTSTAGQDNTVLESNLDAASATLPDAANVQRAMGLADQYVDGRAFVLGLTIATAPHYVATDAPAFPMLRYWASRWARTELYLQRGATNDATNMPEGQMTAMRKEAEARIDELLARVLVGTPVGFSPAGMGVVALAGECCCDAVPVVSGWGC